MPDVTPNIATRIAAERDRLAAQLSKTLDVMQATIGERDHYLAERDRLREELEALAVSWAEDADLPSDMTHDEIVEQQERRKCANELAGVLGLAEELLEARDA